MNPSLHTSPFRILRDRLIMEERLELALQVTLRCGHDATPVWAAMGLRDLEFGQFESARDYFGRCFKVRHSVAPQLSVI